MYNPRDIIEVIAKNIRSTRGPFGIPKFMHNNWWKRRRPRNKGDMLLFTGMMYQLVPYIEKSAGYLETFENTRLAGMAGLARLVPSYLTGIGLAAITPGNGKRRAYGILRDISMLLYLSGVDFYYDPSLDFYSGILLYDLGDLEGFAEHAAFVAKRLKRAGVKKIITVDPHTTYALKVLYPKYTGESFDVKTYFELVDLRSDARNGTVTIHDPCFYGRYLEVSETPRGVLERLGVQCIDPANSGTFTNCCGGPAESVYPSLAKEVMEKRVNELKSTGAPIVTLCPICFVNLKRSGEQVEDISTVMARCLNMDITS